MTIRMRSFHFIYLFLMKYISIFSYESAVFAPHKFWRVGLLLIVSHFLIFNCCWLVDTYSSKFEKSRPRLIHRVENTPKIKTGIYYLTLMDTYAGSWGLLIVALVEVLAISWIYGVFNFIKDIEMMIGEKPKYFWYFWIACWLVITPLLVRINSFKILWFKDLLAPKRYPFY